uniref:NADH-ubiquinone oxidoreductase chain 4 n=1 Tax=Blastopsylla occidentalis TaxID=121832 RepID=A0A2U9QJF2_BLAOC|nr:NADH dehydrogenase subunit 4 [Blastopsylla occidentalis]AWU48865.1 NADH dehydrogenase subunit 4 [Blastopsylla occidentalis]
MLEMMIMTLFMVVYLDWLIISNFLVLMFLYSILNLNKIGPDLLSLIMIMLSIWLILMMILSVDELEKKTFLIFLFIFMFYSLQFCFFSKSLIYFYISFEMSVLPILLILFGWGYQPDRIEAGFYLLCYTVIFSLPFLVGVYFLDFDFQLKSNFITTMVFISGFLVKLPMFGFHLWLPRAHVEAPVYGSMILAGVMLKLGGYGIVKITFFLGDLLLSNSSMLIIFSIMGGVYLSAICFTQSDLKMLIAYSSIVHMSLVISGLLTFKEIGLMGAMSMMIGHGLCSSGLFCVLGFTYNRSHSRSIYINKGYMKIIPICSLWWFLFCSSNLSFPPCLNLPGEILLLLSILGWSLEMLILGVFLNFLSSMYSIYLYSFSQHGLSTQFFSFPVFNLRESFILFMHWLPLNMLILDLSLMSFN